MPDRTRAGSRPITRRNSNRWLSWHYVIPLVLLLAPIAWGFVRKKGTGRRIDFTLEITERLSDTDLGHLRSGILTYLDRYGCTAQERIVVDLAEPGQYVTNLADGSKVVILEQTTPGRITIVPESLEGRSPKGRRSDLRNIGLHACTHACQPDEPDALASPFSIRDGATAYALHGFSVLVRLPDGTMTAFRKIEEGVCEMLAHAADRTYTVGDPSYHRVGMLTLRLIDARGLQPDEVQDRIEANDLWWFVNRLLERSPASRDPRDMIRVMDAYQEAINGADPDGTARNLLSAAPRGP